MPDGIDFVYRHYTLHILNYMPVLHTDNEQLI